MLCGSIAETIDISFDCWPRIEVKNGQLLKSGTFDDERAREVFAGKDWKGVDCEMLYRFPTSQIVLSDDAFRAYLPAIFAAVLFETSEIDEDVIGILADNLEWNLNYRGEEFTTKFSDEQKQFLSFVLMKIDRKNRAQDQAQRHE